MADTKISAFTATTTLDDADEFVVNDSGTTKRITKASLDDNIDIALSQVNDVTATAAEVNILDGVTATTAELNQLDGNILTSTVSVENTTPVVQVKDLGTSAVQYFAARRSDNTLKYLVGTTGASDELILRTYDTDGSTILTQITLASGNASITGTAPTAAGHLTRKDYVDAADTTGNAATSTKLATARTLSVSGDVTGSVSFDGSANADIVSTVGDDSHNHSSSTVTSVTSAVAGTATAGLSYGAVGTYGFFRVLGTAAYAPGASFSGSSLYAANSYGGYDSATQPTGTWQLMGTIGRSYTGGTDSSWSYRTSLFLRTA